MYHCGKNQNAQRSEVHMQADVHKQPAITEIIGIVGSLVQSIVGLAKITYKPRIAQQIAS